MIEKQQTVLLVDDDDNIRRLLRTKLSAEGYHCEEACDAAQALLKLKEMPVELVFLDIRMPGKTGVELLPEIKALYPDSMVVMATATDDIQTAIGCMRKGAYDYIGKPFNMDELVLMAGRAVEKRRLVLENRDYHRYLVQRVEEQSKKIRTSFLSAITSLAYALEAKDRYTVGHSRRVSEMSVALAIELQMPPEDIERIKMAGLTHDIGKIGVMESVLNKSTALTEEERQHVRCHSTIGEHILTPVVGDDIILKMVRHHHEHYDGSGYPDRLAGKAILFGARIMAIADSYDAMTSARPYREALSEHAACNEIDSLKGTQFDPHIAARFLRLEKKRTL